MNLIFDDFKIIKPTILSDTPRLFNIIYSEYQKTLQIKKIENKNFNESDEKELLNEFSGILGGRIKTITTGGAPTSKEVLKFLLKCFKIPVSNGFSSTETGSVMLKFLKFFLNFYFYF
jgi:fatty acid CoA ligase FadD9